MKRVTILFTVLVLAMCSFYFGSEADSSHMADSSALANVEDGAKTEAKRYVERQQLEDSNINGNNIAVMSYSMEQLKQMYPAGSCWNGYWEGGIECVGYALKLCYLYNNCVSTYTYGISHSINDIKVGTMIRYKLGSYDHSIFVTKIEGNTVYYSDANYDLRGTIRWDMKTTKTELARLMAQTLNRPYDVRSHQYSTTGFILCYDKRLITYDISECEISVSDVDRYKAETEPKVVVKHNNKTLTYGKDYSYYYSSQYDDGGTIAIQGLGQYEGEVLKEYKVIRLDLNNCTASYTKTYQYTGNIINPINIVITNQYGKVVDPSLYEVDYSFYPVEPGIYKFSIWGAEEQDVYEGELVLEYRIIPRAIAECEIIYDKVVEFTGKPVYPVVEVIHGNKKLIPNVDYRVEYTDNDDVGRGKITIMAVSEKYEGKWTVEFDIYVKEQTITIH